MSASDYQPVVPERFSRSDQSEYLRFSRAAIDEGLGSLQESVRLQQDLKKCFFDILTFFGDARHKIAERAKSEDFLAFGRRRDLFGCCMYHGEYLGELDGAGANRSLLTFFCSIMEKESTFYDFLTPHEHSVTLTRQACNQDCTLKIHSLAQEDDVLPGEGEQAWQELENHSLYKKGKASSRNGMDLPDTEQKEIRQMRRKFKERYPKYYLGRIIRHEIQYLDEMYPSTSTKMDYRKNYSILATLRLEIDERMYALGYFLTWYYKDYDSHEVWGQSLHRMVNNSCVTLVHTDIFLIEPLLKKIASIFEQAVHWDKEKESIQTLKERVNFFRYLFAYTSPFIRGSAAVGEWYETMIYRFHGLSHRYTEPISLDIEAFGHPLLDSFLKRCDKIVQVTEEKT